MDIGQNNNSPIVLTAVTGSSTFDRSFSVKTSQIECSATNRGLSSRVFLTLLDIRAMDKQIHSSLTNLTILLFQPQMDASNTTPESKAKFKASTTSTPQGCKYPTRITRCASGWRGDSAGFNTRLAPTTVRTKDEIVN